MHIGTEFGLFVRCGGLEWCPKPIGFGELATSLEAVALYRGQVHADLDVVEVVLTPPGKPSQLGDALRMRGRVEADLEHTEAIMRHLAAQAVTRFVVLSPFIDAGGMNNLVGLFTATRSNVQRVLVTRFPNGEMPPSLHSAYPTLVALGVNVHNYWLQRAGGGYETFHAKLLLADASMAYLGSANMTQASLSLSMELGTFLQGNSVATLGRIVDTILSIAPRLS